MPIDMFLARIRKGYITCLKTTSFHTKAVNFPILIEVLLAELMVKNYFNFLLLVNILIYGNYEITNLVLYYIMVMFTFGPLEMLKNRCKKMKRTYSSSSTFL